MVCFYLGCLTQTLAVRTDAIGESDAVQVLGNFPGSTDPPHQVAGWVSYEPWAGPDGTGIIASASTRYWTSMYYVLNALDGNGNTDVERIAAVVAYIFTIMIDGAVAGVMSAMLIGMNGNEREVNDKLRAIKNWM